MSSRHNKQPSRNLDAQLIRAIDKRNFGRIKKLVRMGASPNSTDRHRTPALHCVLYGNGLKHDPEAETIALFLLQSGAESDARDEDGVTPILLAARNGFKHLIRHLIQRRVNLNSRALSGALPCGSTPLSLVASAGDRPMVRILIAAGADVNPVRGNNPVEAAASSGHGEIVEDLLAASGRATGRSLFSPIRMGKLDLVKKLINAGADVNSLDGPRSGNRPLSVAVQSGNAKIVRVLIQAGAQLNAISSGRTPLIFAVCHERIDLVRVLLTAGAKVDARDIYRATALMEAVYRGHREIVSALISAGANPRLKSEVGSAIQIAGSTGNSEMLTLLRK